MKKNEIVRVLLITASLAGMAIMAYLTYAHYAPTPAGGSFCDLGESFSCDVVNKSAYSEVFGIPVAALGVVYFAIVAALSVWRYNTRTLIFIGAFMVVLLGPSLYLSVISKTVLNSMCILCETSKVLMAFIAGLAIYTAGAGRFFKRWGFISAALAVALASAVFIAHRLIVTNPFSYTDNLQLQDILKTMF